MTFINNIKNEQNFQSRISQAIVLYGSMVLSMGLSFIGSMFTARYLIPEDYGGMKFIMTLWYFLNIIISFGFFHSAGQALLKERDADAIKEIIGANLLAAFMMGSVLCVVIFSIASPIQNIFGIPISSELRITAPLLLFAPMKDAFALIFQATNRIGLLAILNSLPPLLFVGLLMILPSIWTPNVLNIIYAQNIAYFFTVIMMIYILKPSLRDLKKNFKKIIAYQKSYGTPVFVAMLSAVATQQINRLGIAYWVDSASIGFFSLANQLVEPVRLIPSTISITAFKEFSKQEKIAGKIIWLTIFATICVLLFVILMLGKPLAWFYPPEYVRNIASLGVVASFGVAIHGFGDLFNRFLGSHGQGSDLKIAAFIVGGFNILGFLVLTPIFGVWGTISSVLLGNCAYMIVMLIFYKRYIASQLINPMTNN